MFVCSSTRRSHLDECLSLELGQKERSSCRQKSVASHYPNTKFNSLKL